MTGYGLIFLLLQEIERLHKEVQELKNQLQKKENT